MTSNITAVPPSDISQVSPPPQETRQEIQQVQQPQIDPFATVITPQPIPQLPPINGKPVNLAIGIPAKSEIDFRWAFAFSEIRHLYPTATIIIDNKYGIAQSRESIVNQFNAIPQLTHLLFIDTDILPPPYGVYTLIQDNVDFVSGIYWNSLYTGNNAWIDEQPLDIRRMGPANMPANPMMQVDKCGMGFCLLTKELMKKMLVEERPLFYYKISEGGLHSEDFYFQAKMKKLGIPVWVDLRVQCGHLKTAIVQSNFQIQF